MIYFALSFLSLCAEEILSTKEGGVIQVGDVRLQGREVTLSKENGEDILHIKGDVLVVQNKKFLIGEELTYNMSKKEGTLTNGTYFVDKYFLGGKKITLSETGALQIEEGYATTSPDKEFPWAVQAKQINLSETSRMQATEIKPSAFNTPFFFLPSYSMALQKDPNRPEPPFQYQFAWESGQGLTTLRSKLMDLSGWKLYGRGEYRIMRGGGAALDLTYKPKEKSPYTFEANNFCAYDTFAKGPSWYTVKVNEATNKLRYRMQGGFSASTADKLWDISGKWDRLSDSKMRGDFPSLFSAHGQSRTELTVHANFDQAYTTLYARPRINEFQGFKQELPTLTIAVKPYELPFTGTLFENTIKAAYLDYVHTKNVAHLDVHTGRIESSHALSHPFYLGPVHIQPRAGYRGIYYTQTASFKPILHYDLASSLVLEGKAGPFLHEIKPYVELQGHYLPLPEKTPILSIHDGHHTHHHVKAGLRNALFSMDHFTAAPLVSLDLYASHLYGTFTKACADLQFQYPSVSYHTTMAWNTTYNVLDSIHAGISGTLNELVAASLEVQHRGKYAWRKHTATDYTLDASRSAHELLNSPLSDERTAIMTRWQVQLMPLVLIQVTDGIGYRGAHGLYHEARIDLITTLLNTAKVRLSYSRSNGSNDFGFNLDLL